MCLFVWPEQAGHGRAAHGRAAHDRAAHGRAATCYEQTWSTWFEHKYKKTEWKKWKILDKSKPHETTCHLLRAWIEINELLNTWNFGNIFSQKAGRDHTATNRQWQRSKHAIEYVANLKWNQPLWNESNKKSGAASQNLDNYATCPMLTMIMDAVTWFT